MLEAICAHLHNYFTADEDIHAGTWTIENGTLDLSGILIEGQYFRIVGSALNDGVYAYPIQTVQAGEQAGGEDEAGEQQAEAAPARGILLDETFTGEIWAMKVPRALRALAAEIEAWQARYGAAMASPYMSENIIGVYSYSRGAESAAAGGSADAWKNVFKGRLNEWRKLR